MDAVVARKDSLKLLRIARADSELMLVAGAPTWDEGAAPLDLDLLRAALPEPMDAPSAEQPINLAFPSRRSRSKSSAVRSTAILNALPNGAFLEVARVDGSPLAEGLGDRARLFVESPALCLVRMAHFLDRRVAAEALTREAALVRLAGLGMELCGTYACDASDPGRGDCAFDLPAVSQAQEVLSFLEEMPRMRGLRLARKAATYVRDGSAPPHETLLSLAYRLPGGLGGVEFAEPLANDQLAWPDHAAGLLKHKTMRPDFRWPQYLLASEYLGEVHKKPGSLAEDSNRIQDYQSCDYSVFPATYEDIRSAQALGGYLARPARIMAKFEGPEFARRTESLLTDPKVVAARAVLVAHLLPPWR